MIAKLLVLSKRPAIQKWTPDVVGIAWLVAFAFLFLSPALKDGLTFAPSDIGSGLSLLTQHTAAIAPHNNLNSDLITQNLPWSVLNWQLVHHGQFPLWNSLSGTGLPQFFNFESAPLSLPSLVSYLFPLKMSLLVEVGVKLLIAGTGAYVLARTLGNGVIAATFTGTTFMLSGAITAWLGWAVSGPLVWAGWILVGCILSYRSKARPQEVILLCAAVGFSLYGGFPETSILLAIGLIAILAATTVCIAVRHEHISFEGIRRVVIGFAGGIALATPLLLPGIRVIADSARNGNPNNGGLQLHAADLIFAQGYFGLPVSGSYAWQNYYETAAYIGVIGVVLGITGVIVHWHRPVVRGLFTGFAVSFLVIYRLGPVHLVQSVVGHIGLSDIAVQRMQGFLALCIAVLAGFGLDVVIRRFREQRVRRSFFIASSIAAVVVLGLWIDSGSFGLESPLSPGNGAPRTAVLTSLRRASLIWPSATIGLLAVLAIAGYFSLRTERTIRIFRALTAVALVGTQSAFLLFAGVGISSYSNTALSTPASVTELKQIVGTSLLGLDAGNTNCSKESPKSGVHCGVRLWNKDGLYPDMNLLYGIDELALHDPTIPQQYFDSWPVQNADRNSQQINLFSPNVNTVALARRYGVSFVLALPNEPQPRGMRLVASIKSSHVYAVPNSTRFDFSGDARHRSVKSKQLTDAKYVINVGTGSASLLAIHVTDSPGWHASIDGKAVALRRHDGSQLSVWVPAGTHQISLYYWPRSLTIGMAIAIATVAALMLWSGWFVYRRREKKRNETLPLIR